MAPLKLLPSSIKQSCGNFYFDWHIYTSLIKKLAPATASLFEVGQSPRLKKQYALNLDSPACQLCEDSCAHVCKNIKYSVSAVPGQFETNWSTGQDLSFTKGGWKIQFLCVLAVCSKHSRTHCRGKYAFYIQAAPKLSWRAKIKRKRRTFDT